MKRVCAIIFMLFTTPALACDATECRLALDVVVRYVSAQRASYRLEDYHAWLATTDRKEPPRWESQTVVKYVEYGEVACLAQLCTVPVKYHSRGTSVPYQSFKAGYAFYDFLYKVKVDNAAALITGDLHGWFVSADTVIQEIQAALMGQSPPSEAVLKSMLVDVNNAVAY